MNIVSPIIQEMILKINFFSKNALMSIIAFFFVNMLFCQDSINGIVLDSKETPLPYSTVHLLRADKDSIINSTYSDSLGYFKMNVTDKIKNEAKYIYSTYLSKASDTLELAQNGSLVKLTISEDVFDLEEVVINGTKPTFVNKADRFVYTPSTILKEGLSSIEVLKITPLLNFDRKNESLSIINKENTTIIINGRKSKLPREMILSILKTTPAKDIKNIEIITNPGSEYTADSNGGIININLKRNLDEGFLGYMGLSTEQSIYNTTILNGSINYRKGKVGIRVSPFINNSFNYNEQNISIKNSTNVIENSINEYTRKYLVLGGGFGLDYDINDRNLLSVNGFMSRVDGDSYTDSKTTYSQTNNTIIDSIYSSPIDGKDYYFYNFGNVYYQHKLDTLGNKKITVNLDYNQFRKDTENDGRFIRETPSFNTQSYKNVFPQDFFNFSSSVDYSNNINDKTKINFGSQLSSTNFDNNINYTNTTNPSTQISQTESYKYKENYLAGYVSLKRNISDKISTSIGLRVERTKYLSENRTIQAKVDSTYTNLFPDLSITYSPKKKKSISLYLARKIRRPSIESLLPGRNYINPYYFVENNPFLQPKIFYNAEVMYSSNYKYYFTGGFSYRDNQYDEFIVPIIENGNTLQKKTSINYGHSYKTYFQFYTEHKLFKGLLNTNFSTSLNYTSFKDETGNILENNITNFNYNVYLNNFLRLSDKRKISAFINMRYISPSNEVAFKIVRPLFNTDIGLKKSFKNLSVLVYFSDIFNSYNQSKIEYRRNQIQLFNRVVKNEYTRSVSISLNYNFGNSNLKQIKRKKIANDELKKRL